VPFRIAQDGEWQGHETCFTEVERGALTEEGWTGGKIVKFLSSGVAYLATVR